MHKLIVSKPYRHGKTFLAAFERDRGLAQGKTVIVASSDKESPNGIHFCIIKPFKKRI